jgi:hypothetical protein
MKLRDVLPDFESKSNQSNSTPLEMMRFDAFLNDALDLKSSLIQLAVYEDFAIVLFGREKATKSIYLSKEYGDELVAGLFHRIASVGGVSVADLEMAETQGSVVLTGSGPVKILPQIRSLTAGGFEVLLKIAPHQDFLHDADQTTLSPTVELKKESRRGYFVEAPVLDNFARGLSSLRRKALALIIRDKKRLAKVCGYLADSEAVALNIKQMEKPLFEGRFPPPVISQADKAFADRMIMIAGAYGFRVHGFLSGGSFHFGIEYPEYRQVLRIYVYDWPGMVEMSLDTIHLFDKDDTYTDMRQHPSSRYQPFTPRDEIMGQFIALLEKSQAMRADFLAGGRKG